MAGQGAGVAEGRGGCDCSNASGNGGWARIAARDSVTAQIGLGVRLPRKIDGVAFRVGDSLQAAGRCRWEEVARVDGHGDAGNAGDLRDVPLNRYLLNPLQGIGIDMIERRIVVEHPALIGASELKCLLSRDALFRSDQRLCGNFGRAGWLFGAV